MKSTHKFALAGFIFGALGLFVLAMLALVSPFFEVVFGPLFAPGRWAAETFVGPNGSDAAVAVLALANGVLYSLVFWIIGVVMTRQRGQ